MEERWQQEFHLCSLRKWLMENGTVQSSPFPKFCRSQFGRTGWNKEPAKANRSKEGKPCLWESRALQPNDEMIQNVPLLSTGFQTGNLFSSR